MAAAPAGFTDEEVATLGKAWTDLRRLEMEEPKDARAADRLEKEREKAALAFKSAIEKVKSSHAPKDILSYTDGWSRVFAIAASDGKNSSPPGAGRARNEQIPLKVRGKDYTFEYGIFLPPRYDGRKSWPLLIALHDKVTSDRNTDGVKYLNEIWVGSRDQAVKDVREQFVIVAPSVGERLNAKRSEDKERIDWFDDNHFRTLRVCIGEAVRQYNIDMNRIYIEGTGTGGQTAIELACSIPRLFAAVAVRGARPVNIHKLANLKGLAAVMFLDRADGAFSGTEGEAAKKQIEELVATHGLRVQFKVAEALGDKGRVRQAMGSQGVDPVHDFTGDVGKFFLEQSRDPFPAHTRFATPDLRRFKDGAWVSVSRADVPEGGTSVAVVEAQADRQDNSLKLTTTNVESFKVLLNDRLLDLDRPVKITLNGKDFLEKKFDRDLDFLLEFSRNFAHDPAMVVNAEMTIVVPRPEEGTEGTGQGDGK